MSNMFRIGSEFAENRASTPKAAAWNQVGMTNPWEQPAAPKVGAKQAANAGLYTPAKVGGIYGGKNADERTGMGSAFASGFMPGGDFAGYDTSGNEWGGQPGGYAPGGATAPALVSPWGGANPQAAGPSPAVPWSGGYRDTGARDPMSLGTIEPAAGKGGQAAGGLTSMDLLMARLLDAQEKQIAKNTRIRDEGLARLGGLVNPWANPEGDQAVALREGLAGTAAQGAREGVHGQNNAIKRMMAGGGLIAQGDLNAMNDNVRAGVTNAQNTLRSDFARRSDEWDRWKIGAQTALEQADLAGSQINNLFGNARSGATLGPEIEQLRATTQNLVNQGKLTAAQAAQAEDVARNQGAYAAVNFIANVLGGVGKMLGLG